MTQIQYPYSLNRSGRTAISAEDDHVRDLMEQVLFTAPGERVNRPDFGSGLNQLIFAPNSDLLVAAVEMSVRASLHQALGSRIAIDALKVERQDSTLNIEIHYRILLTQKSAQATFIRKV